MGIQEIRTRAALIEFQREHRMRDSWHEPDEQGVDAYPAVGFNFDNACADQSAFDAKRVQDRDEGGINDEAFRVLPVNRCAEHGIFLWAEESSEPVAFINLADLLAFATGYEGYG